MFEKLEKEKNKLVEQIENYFYFLKGWSLEQLFENQNKLTKKEKSFLNEILQKIRKIEIFENTELF